MRPDAPCAGWGLYVRMASGPGGNPAGIENDDWANCSDYLEADFSKIKPATSRWVPPEKWSNSDGRSRGKEQPAHWVYSFLPQSCNS